MELSKVKSPKQKKFIDDAMFHFAEVSENQFLVCKLHTGLANQAMKSSIVTNFHFC